MIYSLRTLQAALIAFTRLPLSSSQLQEEHFRYSHYFLPLIGLLIGLLMAALYVFFSIRFTANTSAILAFFFGIILTGGLHEDGLADSCDGFLGGNTREKILDIMKDSRLGSFGVLGILIFIGTKLALLTEISPENQALAFITYSIAARITPLLIMSSLPCLHTNQTKMTQNFSMNGLYLLFGILFAVIFIGLLHSLEFLLFIIFAILITSWLCKSYFDYRLQGYNGDCLGASEQISECVLLFLMAIYY